MSVCKIIAVANQKSGVAKSTTSYNFAACLSEAGKRVLLVDLDPQASLTILYGIDQPDELEFCFTSPWGCRKAIFLNTAPMSSTSLLIPSASSLASWEVICRSFSLILPIAVALQ